MKANAYANLAFVKYWGKRDPRLNIPLNNSISMNLSAARTTTSVIFDSALNQDEVYLGDRPADAKFAARVSAHLDRLRSLAGTQDRARVETRNSFPASTGFASSASGFAALTRAGAGALGLDLDERALSRLARQGSGSACRSIPGGFVEWYAGSADDDSYAEMLAPADHWDIVAVSVIVAAEAKPVSSSDGHLLALDSPFWDARAAQVAARLDTVRRAILERDFDTFGREIEMEALSMHTIMMTSAHVIEDRWQSGVYYWHPDTLDLLVTVQAWRREGMDVYFTLDAGPTVHLMCPGDQADRVRRAVRKHQQGRDWTVMTSHAADGAALI